MHSNSTDIIGITMGCPVGIGPEIIVKMIGPEETLVQGYSPLVIGVPEVFQKCMDGLGIKTEICEWNFSGPLREGVINICCPPDISDAFRRQAASFDWGKPTKETGLLMGACISYCVKLVQAGKVSAMVTCPITKTALKSAGYDYPGHTEMLADLCGARDFAMMMAGDSLKVVLVTIHEGIKRVSGLLSRGKIVSLIELTGKSLKKDFNIKKPKIAVAGLNPHAGESGMFGVEESTIIGPAIEEARDLGWDVSGPFPPDTVFYKARSGEFDVVVCMYHDQGLIPFKLLHFEDGVNVTLGLPIVRTSVDHGTAYDIAGKGVASASSLTAAYKMAAEIAVNRKKGGLIPADKEEL